MRKSEMLIACLMMLAPAVTLAQQTSRPQGTPPPVTEKAQKERSLHARMGQCHTKARANKLKPGTDEFRKSVSACLNGG